MRLCMRPLTSQLGGGVCARCRSTAGTVAVRRCALPRAAAGAPPAGKSPRQRECDAWRSRCEEVHTENVFWNRVCMALGCTLPGMSTTNPSDLTDAEWECAQRYLPPLSRCGRPRIHPLRRILDAVFYVVRTGCAWRYLPANFPPWQTVFYHFRHFRLQGTWHLLYTAVHLAEPLPVRPPPAPTATTL